MPEFQWINMIKIDFFKNVTVQRRLVRLTVGTLPHAVFINSVSFYTVAVPSLRASQFPRGSLPRPVNKGREKAWEIQQGVFQRQAW